MQPRPKSATSTSVHEELWQSFDENGKAIAGRGITKVESAAGALHGSSHVWLWSQFDGQLKFLMQKRGQGMLTWPGRWDATASGHIDFGQTPKEAALRELEEEVGINLTADLIRLVNVHRSHAVVPGTNIIENEFQFVFTGQIKNDQPYNIGLDEVDEVAWHTVEEIKQMLAASEDSEIVYHTAEYFDRLFATLDL